MLSILGPPQLQLNCHVTFGEACIASYARVTARVYIGGVVHFLGVFEFTPYAYPLYPLPRSLTFSIIGGAQCYIGASLDQGSAGLRLGSRSLSEGTDWDFQHTLVDLILSAQATEASVYTQPRPSRIDLCRDHLGSVSAKSNSAITETRLMMMDRSMIAIARQLVSNMANNMQQFGTRGAGQSRVVNEVETIDNVRLENQLTELTSLVRQLAVGQHQICTSVEHPTDMCPTLQETEMESTKIVGAIGRHQYGNQPYSSQPYQR
ncbi:hypothetical protein CR513_35091, partial [Mucuna pruriens]